MKKLLLLIVSATALFAQAPNSRLAFGPWTSTQKTVPFDNRQIGNFYFVLTYQAQGCSALSLTFQSATGVNSAGTMGTYTGTVNLGSNPSTNTSGGTVVFQGFVSWYGVAVSGLSGANCVVSGVVNGFTTGAPIGGQVSSAGCAGTVATPCVVDGVDAAAAPPTVSPVGVSGFDGTNGQRILTDTAGRSTVGGGAAAGAALAGNPFVQALSDGTKAQNALICPSTAVVATSSMGETELVPLTAGQTVRICKVTFTTASAVDVQLDYGTGTACAGGTAHLWALYKSAVAGADDFAADNTWLAAPASNAVCVNLSAGVSISVAVSYAKF